MSTPDSNGDDPDATERNGDDPDATERTNQRDDSEAATIGSASPDASHENGHVPDATEDDGGSPDPSERIAELETLVDVLQAKNERLRTDYARARAVSYRKTALALTAVGAGAVLGGAALPDVRAVLFVTGAVGLFGGILTWYLTPERVVPISVSESVYDGATGTLTDLRNELGLQPVTVYTPVGDQTRGFVPRDRDAETPENLSHVFPGDTSGSAGITFTPSGQRLTRETDEIRTTQSSNTALDAVEGVADSLVEHFEVADRIAVEREADGEDVVVSVDAPAFGSLTRLDHPIVSALACAAAQGVEEPVVVDAAEDATVTLSVGSEGEE
jgi:hypothetical protein